MYYNKIVIEIPIYPKLNCIKKTKNYDPIFSVNDTNDFRTIVTREKIKKLEYNDFQNILNMENANLTFENISDSEKDFPRFALI